MPALSTLEATEKLARVVEHAKPGALVEIYAELYPTEEAANPPSAGVIARQIRDGLEAEEIVDLWNVLFPGDCNVHYNEETMAIHYNEATLEYAD